MRALILPSLVRGQRRQNLPQQQQQLLMRSMISLVVKNNNNQCDVTTATSSSNTNNIMNISKRFMGSGGGTRGARGHGWWVNYRDGKGGRHLQGTYHHLNLEELSVWNDAVFALGSQQVYLQVQMEPLVASMESSSSSSSNNNNNNETDDQVSSSRLVMELATEAFPKATRNFIQLLQDPKDGYRSTTLHRIEKNVGLLGGGHVWKQYNTYKCSEQMRMPESTTSMHHTEPQVLSHAVPGIVTMMMQRVQELDSRFMMLTHPAPHLDGQAVAIGRLTPESLEQVQAWTSTIITQKGHPTTVALKITDCGVLSSSPQDLSMEPPASKEEEPQQQTA